MFWHFYSKPRVGKCTTRAAAAIQIVPCLKPYARAKALTGKKMNWTYSEANRSGDHIWYISDVRKFKSHYPDWSYQYGLKDIFEQIHDSFSKRLPQNPLAAMRVT